MDRYGLEITYSWGDEEPIIECGTKNDAWKKAKELAMNEAEITSEEFECEIGLSFNHEEEKISLYYSYDNQYCYYKVIKL